MLFRSTEYSTFVTAKAMDMKAKELGASISWDVAASVLDGVAGGEFEAEAEFEAMPELGEEAFA